LQEVIRTTTMEPLMSTLRGHFEMGELANCQLVLKRR
jgi:hypothetical protein